MAISFSCDSATKDAEPNKLLFGRWYNREYPLTFIDVEENNYREYMGEINSEIKGRIHWLDSMNFELKIKETEGDISRARSMSPGKLFR